MNLTRGPVAVICAMDSEAVHLRKRLENAHEKPLHAWRRTRGTLSGTPVDIIVSGIGLIYAAAAATAVCLDRAPLAVLNYGCAGAHRIDIDPGDVIIGNQVVHLGSYILAPDGEQRPLGFRVETHEGRVHVDALPTDPEMLDTAQRIAETMALPIWPGLSHEPRIWVGAVGSADIWTQHPDTINELHTTHGSLCEEMEAAAVAQVCATFGTPFLAIKDISNNELQSSTEVKAGDDGPTLLKDVQDEIGLRASLVIEALIRTLS
ncbi:5'-methylthioadenosine/S-adenosylhomocysteine nucleosidase [Candidatus Entotheonella palauensis]|uniref:Nucleoside phosphorylase domain-containing protein n=1 Tax=Candidatus Entotheonella gemina TaxID=1429439 RepID=W4MF09_9BACT|nr:5'-methylthioadenosine/S-adenosylhomocysteine nucleosidase [Candidatus Entotheonella palauensis]ETX08516.1 MAG: hypothetical protein ETSY2_04965 [Candidatus Entotheonella gemina]